MKERASWPMKAWEVRAILAGSKTQKRLAFNDRTMKLMRAAASIGEVSWFMDEGYLAENDLSYILQFCPYGQPGDRLWVRETWSYKGGLLSGSGGYKEHYVTYHADGENKTINALGCENVPKQPPQKDGEEYCFRDAPEEFIYNGMNTYVDRLSRWFSRKIPSIYMPRWATRILLEIVSVRVERLQDISDDDAMSEGIVIQPDGGFGLDDTTHYDFMDPIESYSSLWEAINGEGSWDANPWVWVIEFKRVTP